jgi:hypothetical protein
LPACSQVRCERKCSRMHEIFSCTASDCHRRFRIGSQTLLSGLDFGLRGCTFRTFEGLLGHSFLDPLPARMIGDRAYDSDRLDRDLAERYGIEMIAPHRGVRRKPTPDGRPLRRYCRPWRVERLFAWLHHLRRLVIRWEYRVENFFGMVRLGCMQILLSYA